MQFRVKWASKFDQDPISKEISSLEELIEFCEKQGDDLIVRADRTITVYDDYVE